MNESAVQLSEMDPETMEKAIPDDVKEQAPTEQQPEDIDVVTDKLKKWIESGETKLQVPVSALYVCDVLIKKNAKYKDAWKKFGIYSVIIDLTQKAQRLVGMTWDIETSEWKKKSNEMLSDVEDEGSIFDTIRDIAGYSILALALFEGANETRLRGAREAIERLTF